MHFATGQDSKIFVPKILLAAIDIYANVNAVPANKFRSAVTTLWQSDSVGSDRHLRQCKRCSRQQVSLRCHHPLAVRCHLRCAEVRRKSLPISQGVPGLIPRIQEHIIAFCWLTNTMTLDNLFVQLYSHARTGEVVSRDKIALLTSRQGNNERPYTPESLQ